MTFAEISGLLVALATVGNTALLWRNSLTLKEVHRTTNSLALRNEQIARAAGVVEGMAAEKRRVSGKDPPP